MATTTTTNAYAPNAERAKFRSRVEELLRKRKDPTYVKYAMEQVGYDSSVVDEELGRIQSIQTGQPMTPKTSTIPGENVDQSQLTDTQRTTLLYGQRLFTSAKTLDNFDEGIASKGFLDSIKQRAEEAAVGGTVTNQFVSPEFQQYDQAKRDFINATLRRESGAVISDAEFENANKQYFPVPGDDAKTVEQKKANRELVAKGFLKAAGVSGNEIAFGNEPAAQASQSGPVTLNTPEEAAKWLQENPTDPRADQVKQKLESVGFDMSKMAQTSQETPSGTNTDFTALGGAVGEKLGSFFGGNKIGEAIGNAIGGQLAKYGDAGKSFQETLAKYAEMKANGTIQEEQYNKLVENLENSAKDAFGYTGPSFKQVAADVIKSGISTLGGAEIRGATVLATAAKTAALGAAYGAADATTEDKSLKDTIIQSALSGSIAGAIPIIGKGIGSAAGKLSGRNTPEEALGEILQGKTKDLKPGQKALSIIDTDGIKTYEDGVTKLDESIAQLSRHVDDVLSKDKTITPLSELVSSAKTASGKIVKTNFVERALSHLEEMYKTVGDDVKAANIQELISKASSQGLSKLEVNQIAREYGMSFGDKAFSKLREPLTSVNAQLYETTRKGLKEIARKGVDGKVAQELDSLISDSITTRELFKKNIEAVNKLEQKAVKMGIGQKVVRGALKVADTATMGSLTGLRNFFIQSNVGNKTMNALDIEQNLEKNLKILNRAIKANTPGELEKFIKQLNRKLINKVEGKGGMSIQDVSKDVTKQVQYKTPSGWKTLDQIAREIYTLRTSGTKTAQFVGEEGITLDQALDMARKKVKQYQGRVAEAR